MDPANLKHCKVKKHITLLCYFCTNLIFSQQLAIKTFVSALMLSKAPTITLNIKGSEALLMQKKKKDFPNKDLVQPRKPTGRFCIIAGEPKALDKGNKRKHKTQKTRSLMN